MPRLSEYDYTLPEELIAQTPLVERTASRLLTLDKDTGMIGDRRFTDLMELLLPGDLLVFNNTRVTARRLYGEKLGAVGGDGAKVEALVMEDRGDDQYECLIRPAKRLPVGTHVRFEGDLNATIVSVLADGKRVLQFSAGTSSTVRAAIEGVGQVPLPPYIHEVLADPERYQTVLAKEGGSSAAPTAALHFSRELLDSLRGRGVEIGEVTLDVSIDTFRPVMVDDLEEHVMHGERCSISPEAAHQIAQCRGRIVAVGTTAVRTLESFALPRGLTGERRVRSGTQTTKLFIQPGFVFQVVDAVLTNFHLPRTTMLVMLSAMCPREMLLEAYAHAVENQYRFLSFGDSMLIS